MNGENQLQQEQNSFMRNLLENGVMIGPCPCGPRDPYIGITERYLKEEKMRIWKFYRQLAAKKKYAKLPKTGGRHNAIPTIRRQTIKLR